MKGFDPQFKTLPEYIEKITREIWEDRGIGKSLSKYYGPDVIVRAANAIIIGDSGVTAATLATLNEFPDRRLVYEDVIWTGNEDDGFLSSHRLISVMRKQNAGAYGAGNGQVVRSRIIADCVVKNGVISEEWLVRDHGAFASCLGASAEQLAKTLASDDLAVRGKVTVFTPELDVPGPYVAFIDESPEAQRYVQGWADIWGAKTPALICEYYHQGATIFAPNGAVLNGHDDYDRLVIAYLASFPDATFRVEHLIINRDEGQPLRLALRWSISATHSGWGHYGKPTGAPVYIMGINHAYIVGGRVTMEWICIDEVAIWKQIYAHIGVHKCL